MPYEAGADVADGLGGDISMEDLGLRIRAYRRMRKMTLRQVAEHAEVSASFLSQVERGASGTSIPTLRLIAEALGLTLADLFSAEHSPAHRDAGTRSPTLHLAEEARA